MSGHDKKCKAPAHDVCIDDNGVEAIRTLLPAFQQSDTLCGPLYQTVRGNNRTSAVRKGDSRGACRSVLSTCFCVRNVRIATLRSRPEVEEVCIPVSAGRRASTPTIHPPLPLSVTLNNFPISQTIQRKSPFPPYSSLHTLSLR